MLCRRISFAEDICTSILPDSTIFRAYAILQGEDLDFVYDSISAFSSRRDNQEAVFGAEEGLKDIQDGNLLYVTTTLMFSIC
ncbi:hypothetical protein MKW98_023116 [Papaver atlanticum]|uniref:Uncharacterized protein n=1 Tax=Papaver atlanticum TaxID=357466 RepID=A0AAD4TAP5_9MAGN|nr:hypothetical protein MKW98_023116 [Papaver atlanticum]